MVVSFHSVLVSHFKCEAHADIQHNELVLLSCDGAIKEVEAVAQGGVLAGNVKFLDTQAKGKHYNKKHTHKGES